MIGAGFGVNNGYSRQGENRRPRVPATECVLRRAEMANGPILAQKPYQCAPQVPQRHPDVAFKFRVAGEMVVLLNDGW